jgi:hypothetical protein
MECNHKVQIVSVSNPGSVILISCLIAADADCDKSAISRGRGLGNRCNAAFGICARAVVAKLVRCQGRHDEQMSLAQQLER